MKHVAKTLFAVTLVALTGAAQAEGTKVKDSTVANASINAQNLNLSIGSESLATTGSINIRGGAEVKDSTVLNSSFNAENLNLSIGDKSIAATGSVTVE